MMNRQKEDEYFTDLGHIITELGIGETPNLIWNCDEIGKTFCFEFDCLLNVTCNAISVIYMTAHRCAGEMKKKFDLRSGSQRHRHFVGFFNVPVKAPTTFVYGYSEKTPHLVAFYDTLGNGMRKRRR